MNQPPPWPLPLSAADRRFDLVAVGECMVEFWSEGPLGEADQLRRAYGGDTLNALVAAARLGARTAFISRVGDDPFGPLLRRQWAREGIDVDCAPLVEGSNGLYFISLDARGEREFSYRRAGSAASHIRLGAADEACIRSTRMLLISGITQAISAEGRAATLQAARWARAAGACVAYDPNHRPALWAALPEDSAKAVARDAFAEVLPYVDILLPSLPADAPLLGDQADGLAALAELRRRYQIGVVVAKAGARGVEIIGETGTTQVAAEPVASVIDTTGAGDAWNAAFLLCVLRGDDLVTACRTAHRVAAVTLGHRGAIPPVGTALLEAPLLTAVGNVAEVAVRN